MIGIGIPIPSLMLSAGRDPQALVDTFTLEGGATEYVVGDTITFTQPANTTAVYDVNSIYTFPVLNGAEFKISMYGGGGGYYTTNIWGQSPNGGIMIATMDLSAYQGSNLYIVRGGGGEGSTNSIDDSTGSPYDGGYNGGGDGGGSKGPGGGGRTDLRIDNPGVDQEGASKTTELLVAGGGGGAAGTLTGTYVRYFGRNGGSGDTGDPDYYPLDNGGGGSGYLGGTASDSDDGLNGASGTNYNDVGKTVTVHTNSRITNRAGGNAGHGYFVIEVISIA